MLAVGVDDQDESAQRLTDPGLDRGAVPFVVGMADDAGAGRRCPIAGGVGRPVVDDENFVPRSRALAQRRDAAGPIDAASLKAGITIDVCDRSGPACGPVTRERSAGSRHGWSQTGN